jgi:hypothetical protein
MSIFEQAADEAHNARIGRVLRQRHPADVQAVAGNVPKGEPRPCVDRPPDASGAALSVSPRATVIRPVVRGRDGATKEWRPIQCVR